MSKSFIRQIAHVCIFTRDLERTEAFYRVMFGAEKVFTFVKGERPIGYYLDLGGRSFIEVFRNGEAEFSERNQINHICLETGDMDGFIAQARGQGVLVTDKKLGVDGTWQAWLTDPNGVKLEIFEYTAESRQFGPRGAICQADW